MALFYGLLVIGILKILKVSALFRPHLDFIHHLVQEDSSPQFSDSVVQQRLESLVPIFRPWFNHQSFRQPVPPGSCCYCSVRNSNVANYPYFRSRIDSVPNADACMAMCCGSVNGNCFSIVYDNATKQCDLLERFGHETPSRLIFHPSSIYVAQSYACDCFTYQIVYPQHGFSGNQTNKPKIQLSEEAAVKSVPRPAVQQNISETKIAVASLDIKQTSILPKTNTGCISNIESHLLRADGYRIASYSTAFRDNVLNEETCSTLCLMNLAPDGEKLQCMAAIFERNTSICSFLTDPPRRIDSKTFVDDNVLVSFMKICLPTELAIQCESANPSKIIDIYPKRQLLGFVFAEFAVDTLQQCASLCADAGEKCKAVNYFPALVNGNNCVLKSECRRSHPESFAEHSDEFIIYFDNHCTSCK